MFNVINRECHSLHTKVIKRVNKKSRLYSGKAIIFTAIQVVVLRWGFFLIMSSEFPSLTHSTPKKEMLGCLISIDGLFLL